MWENHKTSILQYNNYYVIPLNHTDSRVFNKKEKRKGRKRRKEILNKEGKERGKKLDSRITQN